MIERRESAGLSIQEVADMIGVNYTTIYRYERAKITNPKLSAIAKIADALNTNIDYLMGYSDDPLPKESIKLDHIKDVEMIVRYMKDILSQDDLRIDGSHADEESLKKLKDAIDIGFLMAEKNNK